MFTHIPVPAVLCWAVIFINWIPWEVLIGPCPGLAVCGFKPGYGTPLVMSVCVCLRLPRTRWGLNAQICSLLSYFRIDQFSCCFLCPQWRWCDSAAVCIESHHAADDAKWPEQVTIVGQRNLRYLWLPDQKIGLKEPNCLLRSHRVIEFGLPEALSYTQRNTSF